MKDIDKFGNHVVKMWMPYKNKKADIGLFIMALGLGGEAGEVMEHIKKLYRDGELDKKALKKELGDVVYYWARICRKFGFSPSSVLDANIEKLNSRNKRGTRRGNGDNR